MSIEINYHELSEENRDGLFTLDMNCDYCSRRIKDAKDAVVSFRIEDVRKPIAFLHSNISKDGFDCHDSWEEKEYPEDSDRCFWMRIGSMDARLFDKEANLSRIGIRYKRIGLEDS